MGFWDRLFGRRPAPEPTRTPVAPRGQVAASSDTVTDDQAVARYRYMVRTAPPEDVEQAHAEAFAGLTPSQRAQVLRDLGSVVPASEQEAVAAANYEPRALARAATRAEMRQPGVLDRSLGGFGGSGFAGTLLASVAGGFIGSMIAQQFFSAMAPQTLGMIDQGMDPTTGGDLATATDATSVEDYNTGDQDPVDVYATEEAGYDDTGFDSGGDDFGGDVGGDF